MRAGLIGRHATFRRLWIGQSISQVGTEIGSLAVPLIAVQTLHTSAFGASALFAAEYAPYVLVGLPAGAWIDRLRRRPVLITADVTRALALLALPLAMLAGAVSLPLLYAVVFVVGIATVFFEVAYQAYLPSVVAHDELIEANGSMTASRSVAAAAGPSAGGWIVAALTAPYAVVADSISFLVSAGYMASIRVTEPAADTRRQRLRTDIRDGLRVVWRDRLIRTLTLYSAATSFAVMMIGSIEVYFLIRTVRLSTVTVGVLFGIASIGSIVGALVAGRIRARLGEIRALICSTVVAGGALLLIPLTAPGARLAFFMVGLGLASAAIVGFNVVSISMTQRRCPVRMLGRVSATSRVIGWSTPPLGALAGGALAGAVGTRITFLAAGALFLVCALVLSRALEGVATDPIAVPDQAARKDSIASGTGTA